MIARERLGKAFASTDFHFADFVARTSGMHDESIWIAALLTSASARQGHICLDLTAHACSPLTNETGDVIATLPSLEKWCSTLRLCKAISGPGGFAPMVLDTNKLYLYRYWRCEASLIHLMKTRIGLRAQQNSDQRSDADTSPPRLSLLKREQSTAPSFDLAQDERGHTAIQIPDPVRAAKSLRDLFGDEQSDQRFAVAGALQNSLCIISGGPGTGKTTTVARIVSLLLDQNPKCRIALSAPTGKAAARMQQAINAQKAVLPNSALFPQDSFTLHRLLGASVDGRSFRHGRDNPLPFDAIIVDEASMVDLELMTTLFEAALPAARIILLGDKDQLSSIEGGDVFGDLCQSPLESGYGDALFVLRKNYRFGLDSGIARLADAVKQGNAEEAMEVLRSGGTDVSWTEPQRTSRVQHWLQDNITQGFRPYLTATDPVSSFEAYAQFRVLCAIHEGPFGVDALNALASEGLAHAGLINASSHWYAGRPVLITQNDHSQQLYNGDTGIVLPDPLAQGKLRAFFPKADGYRSILPAQLPQNETAYAMTVHKTQGSEFGHVLLVLPERASPVLCRELIYTAVTRAKKRIEIVASAEVLSMAIQMQTVRASGLKEV